MSIRDYDEVFVLWSQCDGVGMAEGDSRDDIRAFLRRNPGLSFVATSGKKIVGAVLSSHDGRRGFLYHLAVAEGHRRSGVGRALAQRCLESLNAIGIPKCHIVVFVRNRSGHQFWRKFGWDERTELRMMSKRTR
jgi:N-acetylglutamate synthase